MTRANGIPDVPELQALQDTLMTLLTQIRCIDFSHVDADLAHRLRAIAAIGDTVVQRQPPPATLPLVNRIVFDRLIALAGPDTSRDLLDRLAEDLIDVQHQLHKAADRHDWAALRAQSHILIGLSGAVGAETLQTQAQRLNDFSHDPNVQQLASQLCCIVDPLSDLIRFVQSERSAPAPVA